MPARLTVHVPGASARSIPLSESEPLVVGRDPSCGLFVRDGRVSIRHAVVAWRDGAWTVIDQQSKNGTLVNALPVQEACLTTGDWISFGGCHARFELLTDEEAASERNVALERRRDARDVRERLLWEDHPEAILVRLMESVLSVTGAERGFLLATGQDGGLEPQVAVGFGEAEPPDRFEGSAGAVRRVVTTGETVVSSDAREHAFLGKRPSVQELGLRALACLPLHGPTKGDLVGVLYVDGRRAGGVFTELDLELLSALAEKAALIVEGMRIDRRLRDFLRDPRQAAVLERLSRHLAEAT